jgi:hypothetical protein
MYNDKTMNVKSTVDDVNNKLKEIYNKIKSAENPFAQQMPEPKQENDDKAEQPSLELNSFNFKDLNSDKNDDVVEVAVGGKKYTRKNKKQIQENNINK